MARTFANTTADNLQLAASAITAAPVTLSAWVNLAAVGTVVRTIIDINNSASAQFRNCFRLEMNTTETIQARTGSASASSASQTAGALTAGTWAHAGAVFASTTSRTAYLNGTAATTETTSRAVTGINQVTIGVESHSSGTLALPWNGEIAEAAVWDVALDAGEMAALAKGVSPLLVRPTSLIYYWPIVGKYSPEIDLISAGDMTVTGTAAAAHPRVFLPKRSRVRRFTTAVAGGLGIPIAAYHYNHHLGSMSN